MIFRRSFQRGGHPRRKLWLFSLMLLALVSAPAVLTYAAKSNPGAPAASSTSPNAVIVQYMLPQPTRAVNPNKLLLPSMPPFTLYGDGTVVCGQDSANPFSDDGFNSSTHSLPTTTKLSNKNLQSLLQQISDTGFLNLNKEYYNKPIAEHQSMLRVSLASGEHYVLYYNDVSAPAAYTATLNLLKKTCKQANKLYVPSTATFSVLKAADPGQSKVTPSNNLDRTLATALAQNEPAADQAYASAQAAGPPFTKPAQANQVETGSAANKLVKDMGNNSQQYVADRGTIYEIGLSVVPPTASNPLNVPYAANRQAQANAGVGSKIKSFLDPKAAADGQIPVRFVLLLPTDASNTQMADEAQYLTGQINNWYYGQVEMRYNYQNVSIIRGSQTENYYMTCHDPAGCTGPVDAVFRNLQAQDSGTIYRTDVDTIVVTSWNTNDPSGTCGEANVASTIGLVDLYSTCERGALVAHELGHTFGLGHTHNGTLMDPSDDSGCDIPSVHTPCWLDPGQANQLRTAGWPYFPSNGSPTSSPPEQSGNQGQIPSVLYAGQAIYPDQYLSSPNGQYRLAMQRDGNLVLYSGSSPIWASNTFDMPVAYVVLGFDGNLVMFSTGGAVLWQTHTFGTAPGGQLWLQDDSNVVLKNANGNPVWSFHTGFLDSASMVTNQGLAAGHCLVSDSSGRYRLCMQPDGNLVIYNINATPLWYTGTQGTGANDLIMQPDGNLVLYNTATGQPFWYVGYGSGANTLIMQTDGNLVLYASGPRSVWYSGTQGR